MPYLENDNNVITFHANKKQETFFAGKSTMFFYEKDPNEQRPIQIEFDGYIPAGATLNATNSTITAVDENGADKSSDLIVTNSKTVIRETKLQCTLKSGTADQDYILTFTGETVGTAFKYVQKVLLQIRQKSISAA